MGYPRKIQSLLERAGVDVGDEVRVECKGKKYSGTVMPHHSFSDDRILTIKLENGYNLGLEVTPDMAIKRRRARGGRARPRREPVENPGKSTISFLGTGGTIASYVDYRSGAVFPALTAEDLAFSVPELQDLCNVRARVLFSILSEDMKPKNWQRLAREVAKELNMGSKAVVIPHGTDTLGFTSAALSFMIKGLTGPVILVGAQRSSDRPSSDAYLNLFSAAHLASTDLGEVVVVMHEETSDAHVSIHRGTKVRKMHSSRRDAFRSVDETPLGRVHVNGEVTWLGEYRRGSEGKVVADTPMEENVALLYTYPGMKPDIIDTCAELNKGIVLAGTGLGHTPKDLVPRIRRAAKKGVHIVMTSQCLYGRVGMYVYSRGRELAKAGVISGEDMLPETALVKLMWVLGHTEDSAEVKELMTTNVAGEINPQLSLEDFEGE